MDCSRYDTIDDKVFLDIDPYDFIKTPNTDILFLIQDRQEVLSTIQKKKEDLHWNFQRRTWRNIMYLRTVARDLRLWCQKQAREAHVNWNPRSWKGWNLERRSWKHYRNLRTLREYRYMDDRAIQIEAFHTQLMMMVINLENLIERTIENNERPRYGIDLA